MLSSQIKPKDYPTALTKEYKHHCWDWNSSL